MANFYISINLDAAGSSDTKEVKVSVDDTTPAFLEDKIVAGSSKITATTSSPGGDEKLEIDVDTSQIDHNLTLNYVLSQHRVLDDASTTTTTLWSSTKIQALLDAQDDAVEITYAPRDIPAWDIEPTDVAEGLDELVQRVNDDEDALAAHLSDAVDAHDATAISNLPAGTISATTVQAALNELDTEKYVAADFDGDFDTRLATKDTDDVSEGSGNLYFTDTRAKSAVVVDSMAGTETDQSPSVNSVKVFTDKNATDIDETTFTFADNVAVLTDITGLLFPTATVRAFNLTLIIERDGDSLYEELIINGILGASEFDITIEGVGSDTGVEISVDSSGQFQYTSSDLIAGGTLIFKAKTFMRVS